MDLRPSKLGTRGMAQWLEALGALAEDTTHWLTNILTLVPQSPRPSSGFLRNRHASGTDIQTCRKTSISMK